MIKIYAVRYRRDKDDPLTTIPYTGILAWERALVFAERLESKGYAEVTCGSVERVVEIHNVTTEKFVRINIPQDGQPCEVVKDLDFSPVSPSADDHIRVTFRILGENIGVFQCQWGRCWFADPTAVRQDRIHHKGVSVCHT